MFGWLAVAVWCACTFVRSAFGVWSAVVGHCEGMMIPMVNLKTEKLFNCTPHYGGGCNERTRKAVDNV